MVHKSWRRVNKKRPSPENIAIRLGHLTIVVCDFLLPETRNKMNAIALKGWEEKRDRRR
jgi:hypothetical protein